MKNLFKNKTILKNLNQIKKTRTKIKKDLNKLLINMEKDEI